ncbi:MAG: hypothetical protein V4651_05210 [Bacteroidota bacterium]
MLKDIKDPISEGVTMAAVYELNDEQEMVWNMYLLNYKDTIIDGVLITSKGYGEKDGQEVTTSILRHFVKEIPPQSVARIEPLQEDVFALINEYFVTYYVGNTMYELKFIFDSYSISLKNTVLITFMGQQGIEVL